MNEKLTIKALHRIIETFTTTPAFLNNVNITCNQKIKILSVFGMRMLLGEFNHPREIEKK